MKVLELKELYERAYPYYQKFCNITEKTPPKRKEKWVHTSEEIWKQIEGEKVTVLCVKVETEPLPTKLLTPEWLEQHVGENTVPVGGVLYLIVLEDRDLQDHSVLKRFYYEMWYGAVIMAAKDRCFEDLQELENKRYAVSESFAPGFDEIPCEKMEKWLEVLDPEKRYCTVNKEFIMEPSNSLLGMYLMYEK